MHSDTFANIRMLNLFKMDGLEDYIFFTISRLALWYG